MIFWQAGLALVIVWNVFRDPAIDYRLVAAGAVLPDLVDGVTGGVWIMHTLVASIVLLTLVMLATRHRRRTRRRLLALPIATFLHLVLDGSWTDRTTFWWPAFGWRLDAPLPSLDHGLVVLLVQEAVGLVALAWFWRRFHLGDRDVRSTFLRTGRLAATFRREAPSG